MGGRGTRSGVSGQVSARASFTCQRRVYAVSTGRTCEGAAVKWHRGVTVCIVFIWQVYATPVPCIATLNGELQHGERLTNSRLSYNVSNTAIQSDMTNFYVAPCNRTLLHIMPQ